MRAGKFVLRLYVAGSNERSMRAVESVTHMCHEHLAGRYDLTVVDIYEEPALAAEGQVVAVPTLVRQEPGPLRRIVGDMADENRVLGALDARWAA